jgi:hypothetical protein
MHKNIWEAFKYISKAGLTIVPGILEAEVEGIFESMSSRPALAT